MNIIKESRERNLVNLKNSIDLGTIDEIIKPTDEWGGAHVIITSSNEKALNHDANDICVLTRHSQILSGLFFYIKENILFDRDFFLYGFMALLAIDYLRQNGESDDYNPFLKYVIDNIYAYFLYFNWESGIKDIGESFDVMRNYLSDEISNNEISKVLGY